MSQSEKTGLGGLHHVTAICSDPVRNIAFYSGILGLRLVKKTVNFDDPGSYHLYYGDSIGRPGTLITFFAWTGVPPLTFAQGRAGAGQIGAVSFRVPTESVDWWSEHLASTAVDFQTRTGEFGSDVLVVRDPDGIAVELVGEAGSAEPTSTWAQSTVPGEHAIRSVAGVSILTQRAEHTARVLTDVLGFDQSGREGARHRFELRAGDGAGRVDLIIDSGMPPGRMGIGAIHHVAWRVSDAEQQVRWRERLLELFIGVTDVMDRQYFRSIYFTEPGGVEFEIATDGPGFTVDESAAELGTGLMLPPWLEERRSRIMARLPELRARSMHG